MENLKSLAEELASIPWSDRLLQDEGLVLTVPESRRQQRSVRVDIRTDAAFRQLLNTEDAIPLYLVLYRPPSPQEQPSGPQKGPVTEVLGIIRLGAGVSGFPNVCHGGIVGTLLDEIMGELITVNLKHRTIPSLSFMTAYLNITYLRPVRAPSAVLARARLVRLEARRKLRAVATIEDGNKTVLAKAEALFVGVSTRL
ncbi:hypothetical protein VTK73DRAFT_7226 [Phialemonium thermophilum]|uniref:Thioesterase domain-containing protein n=1 Tax=Phialemonium thermophilum TaxID=223376 RepID=A0ABR3WFL4_9PEZI